MKSKSILLIISILLFITGCVNSAVSANAQTKVNINEERNSEIFSLIQDSIKEYIEQEINYYAPQSGSVNLAWNVDNHPLDEAVKWNDKTTLTDGLLYIPMEAQGDTFKVNLKVPVGSIVQYYFWITKNKQGHYVDFWDLESSGTATVSDIKPIYKQAIYSKTEEKKEPSTLTYGWLILLLLIVVYFLLFLILKKVVKKTYSPESIEKIIFLGISLAVFHALARAEIINVNVLNLIYDLRIIPKIVRASFSDFLFIAGIVAVFAFALWIFRKSKIRNWIYGTFLFVSLFSTLVAFINITTVIYLGKPLNYQWLYYSDFLGSNEAKTALLANLSLVLVVNLVALPISMLIFSVVIRHIYRLLTFQKHLRLITFSIIGLALIMISAKAFKTKATWTNGQYENAITSMLNSIYNVNSSSSFFTADLPQGMPTFNPSYGTEIETQYLTSNNNNIKNVLFIILESAGACYFDGYGGTFELSPNLNKYANQALMFDQAYAHAPATNRSLVSILGSIYPFISYKSITQEAPDVDHPTISSVLGNEGYRTSFFSSADLRFQNCRQFLAHRGFDVVEDFSAIKCSEEFQLESANYLEGNGIDDICLSDRLSDWIDEDISKNFFSMIWTVQGHYPYFFAQKEKDFGVSNYNFNRYLNCLNHNDELVGKVMHILEERGLAETTLVVVIGDHGEAFGQHNQYGHGTAIYEENLKVPLYFINSTLFHGERKGDIAGMKDLSPTVLSIIGKEIPEKWQGRNLLKTTSDEAFYFAPWSDYLFGYRKQNMKYIFNESQNTIEVYNLNNDLAEKNNLIESVAKEDLDFARSRVAAWVQYQDKFIKEIRNENETK